MVEVEHAAKTLTATNASVIGNISRTRSDQPVAQSLMVPFFVIMLYELRHRTTQRRLSDENHPIQAFLLDRAQ
jgi:hypothetical protein